MFNKEEPMKRFILRFIAKIKTLTSPRKHSDFYYYDEEASYELQIQNNKVRYLMSLEKAA